jgi:hypothetical protein
MDASLRAGVAAHNAGSHAVAAAAWRLADADARLPDALATAADALAHADDGAWDDAAATADSAVAALDAAHDVDVDVAPFRAYLDALRSDPELRERRRPPRLRYRGRALSLDDLRFESAAVAARALADVRGYDPDTVARAVTFAREEIEGGERTQFTESVLAFVASGGAAMAYRRLADRVERLEREFEDVEGLF